MEQLPLRSNQLSATLVLWTTHKMFLHVEMAVSDSYHETQRVEFVRNAARPWPATARTGLLWCHPGWASDRPGPMLSLYFEAASFRGQRMLPKCAKFRILTKFLGCTGITLCNTDSCLNAFFFFSFFLVLWMKSGKTLLWQYFLKNNQTRTISIFLLFCIYLSIFFSLFSH